MVVWVKSGSIYIIPMTDPCMLMVNKCWHEWGFWWFLLMVNGKPWSWHTHIRIRHGIHDNSMKIPFLYIMIIIYKYNMIIHFVMGFMYIWPLPKSQVFCGCDIPSPRPLWPLAALVHRSHQGSIALGRGSHGSHAGICLDETGQLWGFSYGYSCVYIYIYIHR